MNTEGVSVGSGRRNRDPMVTTEATEGVKEKGAGKEGGGTKLNNESIKGSKKDRRSDLVKATGNASRRG